MTWRNDDRAKRSWWAVWGVGGLLAGLVAAGSPGREASQLDAPRGTPRSAEHDRAGGPRSRVAAQRRTSAPPTDERPRYGGPDDACALSTLPAFDARYPETLPAARDVVQRCQALGPAAPYPINGLDCATGTCGELGWEAARPIDWQRYAQGEYVGHERLAHVASYRLRVDDELDFVFRLTRIETSRPYQLNVGDEIRVESITDETINRDLVIQPDGTISLMLLGQVRATGRTVEQLRRHVEQLYTKYYRTPAITITPLRVNTKLEDLRATVDSRFGFGGQSRHARVTPEGTIQLPLVESVPAQGLTLDELKRELDERYAAEVEGIEVTPVLTARAPRYVYVVGEVASPGRYPLEGPTTVMMAISLAGGWVHGGNLWRSVVFRRADDWRLMATMLDLRGPLYGHRPCPADEIWLNDSDIVLVPKSKVLVADNIINLVFTRGVYGVFPFNTATVFSFTKLTAL